MGDNSTVSVSNNAENPGSFTNVGVVTGSQMYFSGTCTLGHGASLLASNHGTGSIGDSQISFQNGFSLAGTATFAASNTGSVSNHGILIADATGGGGNVNIILNGTDLYVPALQPTLTIGALNGNSTAIVQSQPQLIIQTDPSVNAVFAGSIQDFSSPSSLVLAGSGTQTLSGNNTFTGPTEVQGGTLILNGLLTGDLFISSAGTVKGTGTAGTVTLTGGIIAPGQSIGTLHFANYTSTDGTYEVEVNGLNQSDLIDVTGVATLNAGVVQVSSVDGTYTYQKPYTIVTAGTRTGTYASVSTLSPMLKSTLSYDDQHVYLTLLSDTLAAAKTHNERNVATELDQIINPTPLQSELLDEIVNLSLDEGTKALDSLSGWQYTSDLWLAQTINGEFVKRLYDNLRFIVTKTPAGCQCSKETTVWIEGGGTFGKLNGNENAHGFGLAGGEVTLGVQKNFLCNLTLGLSTSYEYDHLDYHRHGGSGNSNTWFAGMYGLYRPSYFYTLADLTYGYTSIHMNRIMHAGERQFKAHGKPSIQQFSFYGEIGGDVDANVLLFQPFLGITTAGDWCSRIREHSSSGWEMKIDPKNSALVKSRLGLHITNKQECKTHAVLDYSLDVAWNKRITGTNTGVPGEFVEFGTDFIINGVNLNSNSIDFALALSKWVKGYRVYLQGSGEVWNQANKFDIVAGLQRSW